MWWYMKPTEISTSSVHTTTALRVQDPNYKFVSPLLLCGISETKTSVEYSALRKKVDEIIASKKIDSKVTNVSVYFRDLTAGRWMGINENDKYSPASLLKVPTMIALYKFAEENPKFLDKRVVFDDGKDENINENFKPSHAIEPGKSYTIRELIGFMIKYSDNNARRLLHNNIDLSWVQEVYSDLGLGFVNSTNAVDVMSAKQYSYFFRVLYNASYISKDFSEEALATLEKSDFSGGILAGVPKGVSVANKFGEREFVSGDNEISDTKELHDCGIVYTVGNPYLLCVMTKGKDFAALNDAIKAISGAVYADVTK